ncbi:MAG: Gfo/Idh/MocA family oxidoreductase [Saccharofermentanales bacterium]
MDKVRFGIIGLGNMGSTHVMHFVAGKIKRAEISAVCDVKADRLKWAKGVLGENVGLFTNAEQMFESESIDAVLIAVPHYLHPVYAIKAMKSGIHALVEKPAGVYTKQVMEMNEVADANPDIMFGIMFNQRTNPVYRKAKELVQTGEIGNLKRVNWIITDWYRTQAYYNSSDWRATWKGEGGGVLLNQSPHQLDLLQWICGMPQKVRAFCSEGKFHDIEVEDDVTAFAEYENGATAVFVTSTGDAPGSNRLEIQGDMGKIIIEDEKLSFWKLRVSEREFCMSTKQGFGMPEMWKCEIPLAGGNLQHVGIINNFTDAIIDGVELLADGKEGINGVELANAMYLSSWLNDFVEIPVDSEMYYEKLKEKIKNSISRKIVDEQITDLSGTY